MTALTKPSGKQVETAAARWRSDGQARGLDSGDIAAVTIAYASGAIHVNRGDALVAALPGEPLPDAVAALCPSGPRSARSPRNDAPAADDGDGLAFANAYFGAKHGDETARAELVRMSKPPASRPDTRDPLAFADQTLKAKRADEREYRERRR